MSRFKELGEYKNKIMMCLLSNQNIVKALTYNTPDFSTKPDVDDPSSLIYNNIFPYKNIPLTQNEQKTFITMCFSDYRKTGRSFKIGYIDFYIFTHFNLMPTDLGILRTDYILSEIDDLFNEYTDLGIGRLMFDKMNEFQINEYFSGYIISYKDTSYN